MNRRKAIFSLLAGGAAVATAAGVYKWVRITGKPDLGFLETSSSLLAELAETIIPATDTPGAKEAGAHLYIIKMIRDCSDRKVQNNFIHGLKDLQEDCISEYGREFQSCLPAEKEAILAAIEKKQQPYRGIAGKVQRRVLGESFISTLKMLTVEGYCSSKPGATIALAYDYVPGHYSGCVPFQTGQKAWATN